MAARSAEVEERKKKALFLWLGGMSMREIAKEFNCGKSSIERDIKAAKKKWEEDNANEIADIAQKELMKLEQWESRITITHNKAGTDKDTRSKVLQEINAKMKIQQRRLRLLGLDRVLVVNVNENYDMSQFSDDELEQIINHGVSPKDIISQRNAESNSTTASSRRAGAKKKNKGQGKLQTKRSKDKTDGSTEK